MNLPPPRRPLGQFNQAHTLCKVIPFKNIDNQSFCKTLVGQTKPWIKAHQFVLPDGEKLGQDGSRRALDWGQLFGVIEWALALSLWVPFIAHLKVKQQCPRHSGCLLCQPGCALPPLPKVVLSAPLIQNALQLPLPRLPIYPPLLKWFR